MVKGQAKRIDYYSATQSLELTGDAQMRRLRAGQIADETMGHTIRYNSDDGKFAVVGKAGAKDGGDGRVRAVIAPRAKPIPVEK
jgi:lipopolysaccharide transport protein LptA